MSHTCTLLISRAIEMYSRSVTPTPGRDDIKEARNDQNDEENYTLTNISMDGTGTSVKYFNYPSNNLLPAKSLAQEMLESESDIYNESSKLLDNIEH